VVPLLAVTACDLASFAEGPPAIVACEEVLEVPLAGAAKADVLMIVDHADVEAFAAFEQALAWARPRDFDLRLAIVAADGGEIVAVLIDRPREDGTRDRNFEGTFAEAIFARAPRASGPTAALAAMEATLPWVRADAEVLVAIVSDDDDVSPELPSSYVELFDEILWNRGVAAVVAGPADGSCAIAAPAPRLAAFADGLRHRASFGSLCGGAEAGFDVIVCRTDCVPEPICVGDVDPASCVVADGEAPLPRCERAASPGPCWSIAEDPASCPAGLRVEVHRPPQLEPATLAIRCPCAD
jgi:hypothetical protein